MQATLSFARQSRLQGVCAVTARHAVRLSVLYACVMLAVHCISIAVEVAQNNLHQINWLDADGGLNAVILFAALSVYAGRETRYFAGLATGRPVIFAGALCKIVAAAAALTLLSSLMSALIALPHALSGRENSGLVLYAVNNDARLYGMSGYFCLLTQLCGDMWTHFLWLLQMGAMCYFFLCCLNRWRAATLCVVIGGGVALMAVVLVPTFRSLLVAAENMADGNAQSVMSEVPGWLRTLRNVVEFILNQWPLFRLLIALGCLPLSYLVMSRAKLPK